MNETVRLRQKCPDCAAVVLECDNGVRLSVTPNPDGDWGLMPLGGLVFAAGGAVQGTRYDLHEHQPPEH